MLVTVILAAGVVSSSVVSSFRLSLSRQVANAGSSVAQLAAIPVSTLPLEASYIVSPASPSNDGSITATTTQALGLTSSIITYVSLLLVYDRPKGSLELDESYLSIRESNVPGAGLGLYAVQTIKEGTVLGTYAGVVRPAQEFYSGKCRQFPGAVSYSWRFTDNQFVIDPTDERGEIQFVCQGGSDVPLSNIFFSLLGTGKSTALCRINEPPIGAGGCNVGAKENLDKREVVFTTLRDIFAGEELFLDYGLDYDRSGYRQSPS